MHAHAVTMLHNDILGIQKYDKIYFEVYPGSENKRMEY